ncbi:hypothetical protein [Nevskia ramosa]|uniref:hypothetical protein n=1 Tax=Nevskia ramosa TaxID=64002 RepID=UPI002354307A|nr:hypothetical protein [Nevskia ramosa]
MEFAATRSTRRHQMVERSLDRIRNCQPPDVRVLGDTMDARRSGVDPNDVACYFRNKAGQCLHTVYARLDRPFKDQVHDLWSSFHRRFPKYRQAAEGSITLCHE